MNADRLIDLMSVTKEDENKLNYYCNMKGIMVHLNIFVFLTNFKIGKVSYSEVATAYRYDKRIRIVLYQFIGLFEEYIRAYIANKYMSDLSSLQILPALQKQISKGFNLSDALDSLFFSDLMKQVDLLSDMDKKVLFPRVEYLKSNITAIKSLRNAVSHNRFLLNYLDFEKCTIDGEVKNSLYSNLINFSNHLNEEISKSFFEKIKKCKYKKRKSNKYPNQTEWKLMKEIVVALD